MIKMAVGVYDQNRQIGNFLHGVCDVAPAVSGVDLQGLLGAKYQRAVDAGRFTNMMD